MSSYSDRFVHQRKLDKDEGRRRRNNVELETKIYEIFLLPKMTKPHIL